eukprot:1959606-Amphidinium_carterae.1
MQCQSGKPRPQIDVSATPRTTINVLELTSWLISWHLSTRATVRRHSGLIRAQHSMSQLSARQLKADL